ncbi:glycosyltransferase family 4 protein [Geofilum sp. OHC36d9]|uniref:glycosyltransferase family 4 protein n=1 Tax=Geofilum sp. OHC36d9 TaxID=3458413 RepID=UPI0040333175
MRVLISSPDLDVGKNVSGISSVVRAIMREMPALGVELLHLKEGRSDRDRFGIAGYFNLLKNLISFPFVRYGKRVSLFHQNVPFTTKGIIREFLFSWLAKWCHLPVLVHVHGGIYIDEAPSRWLYKMTCSIFDNASKIIVLNDYEKTQVAHLYGKKTEILENVIDTDYYSFKDSFGGKKHPVLLFLGRIHEEKGLNEILEAFSQLYPSFPFTFVMCGFGTFQARFRTRFEAVLGSDFQFKGVVSGDSKLEAIKRADYFLLPSYTEGLPIALLETMSCGVIPVVSDHDSMRSMITDFENGIMVKRRSATHIVEQMKKAFALDAQQRLKMAQNARQTILTNYSMETYNKRLMTKYNEVLDGYKRKD